MPGINVTPELRGTIEAKFGRVPELDSNSEYHLAGWNPERSRAGFFQTAPEGTQWAAYGLGKDGGVIRLDHYLFNLNPSPEPTYGMLNAQFKLPDPSFREYYYGNPSDKEPDLEIFALQPRQDGYFNYAEAHFDQLGITSLGLAMGDSADVNLYKKKEFPAITVLFQDMNVPPQWRTNLLGTDREIGSEEVEAYDHDSLEDVRPIVKLSTEKGNLVSEVIGSEVNTPPIMRVITPVHINIARVRQLLMHQPERPPEIEDPTFVSWPEDVEKLLAEFPVKFE